MDGPPVVLEVGPEGIRCGGIIQDLPAATVAAALDGIDDPVVLLDERPVRVDDLLRSLIATALGGRRTDVRVVHPESWPMPRVVRVLNAVRASADRVVPVPDGEAVHGESADETGPVPLRTRIRLQPRVIAGVLGIAALSLAVALLPPRRLSAVPSAAAVTSTVVEGRVAVAVPDGWTVERLTRGPGSRRVRVSSPADPDRALHITQSYAPGGTLADTAAILGRAAAGQPAITGFQPDDEVAGRPAVTYREIRPGRVIRWVVLLDGVTRISIGCQSRPGGEEGIRTVCEQAIRSAHDVDGTAPPR